MLNKSSRQTGNVYIIIIVILVVLIMGVLGFIFWNNFFSKSESNSNPMNVAPTSETKSPVKAASYTLNDAVQGISTTLSTVCSSHTSVTEDNFVQVKDTDPFEYRGGKTIIDQQFNYAYVQYGCGSEGNVALMKRSGTDWRIVSDDARIYPMCKAIEGEDFPLAIVDKCYETDTSAEPTDIK